MTQLLTNTTQSDPGYRHQPDYSLQAAAPFNQAPRPFWTVGFLPLPASAGEWEAVWPLGDLYSGSPWSAAGILWGSSWDALNRAYGGKGAKSYKRFSGITRDTNGAALGGMTVKLFHTVDDTLIASTVSDTSSTSPGAYDVYSPYTDSHYLVVYKAGAPDVSGTTVNTLTGV